jgi:hypothetical protein
VCGALRPFSHAHSAPPSDVADAEAARTSAMHAARTRCRGYLDGRSRCCLLGERRGGTPTGRELERGVPASTPLCCHLRCLGVSHEPQRRCANLAGLGFFLYAQYYENLRTIDGFQ